MMAWLIYDAETGEQLRLSETNDAGEGELGTERPGSAMADNPSTHWDATLRTHVDSQVWMSKFAYLLLWTATEMVGVKESSDPDMVRAFMLLNAWDGPINLLDAQVQAGITLAESLGILTEARADRIRAGLLPE